MAIVILGKSKCPLCAAVLSSTDEIVAFPHFIQDPAHPLSRFSDSAMHRACFVDWRDAKQFRAIFNEAWPQLVPDHPREMQADGTIVEIRTTFIRMRAALRRLWRGGRQDR